MNNPLKNLNGMTRTVLTAVVVSSIMSIGSTVTAVRVMESDVKHLDTRLERHEHIPGHLNAENRVGNTETKIAQLTVIIQERRVLQDERWNRIESELQDIKNELRNQRRSH